MIVTHRIAQNTQFPREVNTELSLTIPDQAISVEELIRQYQITGGVKVDVKNQYYDTDLETPEFHQMDKLDLLHNIQENAHAVHNLKTIVKQQKQAAEKAKQDEAERSDAKDAKAEKSSAATTTSEGS